MSKNVLNPKNLRWLTVYLFLGLMVLLLALNLFVPSSNTSANNATPTQTTQGAVIICQKALHVSCKQAEHIVGTANAFATTTAAKATAAAVKATAAAAKATAAAAKATAAAKPTVTVTATVTVTTTPGSGKNS